MVLTKLGRYIKESKEKNDSNIFGESSVVGISTQKEMIHTKANLDGVNLTSYKLVPPNHFAFVSDTSRRGDKISLCFNNTCETYLVSSISTVFFVENVDVLNPLYLFMFFNRPEFDRYARYNSWGSAREAFGWDEMCDVDINLPPKRVQDEYVSVYEMLCMNQKKYESGLEDLKLVCEANLDNIKNIFPGKKLRDYISISDRTNEELKFDLEDVRGVSIEKKFIDTKANLDGVSLKPYLIVEPNEFAYVTVTSRNGEKISLARNDSTKPYICSSSYIVFRVNNTNELLPEYLSMYFERSEFDRYARFNSWGSARETFDWDEMCDVEIPIPDIEIQRNIVNIYKSINLRKEINNELKTQIKNICPILIMGSIEAEMKG